MIDRLVGQGNRCEREVFVKNTESGVVSGYSQQVGK